MAAPMQSLASGTAVISNKCGVPVFVTSVDSTVGATTQLTAGATWTEALHYDPKAGIAIKVTTSEDGLYNGSPTLTLGYTLNNGENSVYYDLSSAFGLDPLFAANKLTLATSKASCPSATWDHVTSVPIQNSKACIGDSIDVVLTLCA
ncbi:hypothetical protein EJ04DRAFT_559556 [Polyplosphaeria fusca]|uniref:Uncharacterized protein n=1 Tax=Polyplosphaeria fusca TaxID=682080 RepID=A0A9P4R5S4_9PLEO|nr:hypothetical protein EJ04DRAFT_559556 [Polyplosphaeria fusca]